MPRHGRSSARDLLILGHHYQRDEVIKFADYTGDSWKLVVSTAQPHRTPSYVIFCGVHFMAESADILAAPHQQVILPDLAAGCSMADMAAADQLEMCWKELEQMGVTNVIPVTYINSAASIKSFVGERGGTVCTSGNAKATLKWAWSAASASCSCPISTSDATPPTRWACRSTRWWCGIRTSSGAASNRRKPKPRR